MDLSIILAISGKSGLYKVVSQIKNGIIVESLEDGKKMPVFATSRSSSLEDISVFTVNEDLPLKVVFKKIYDQAKGEKVIDQKADKAELVKYFESILPDYDAERVYLSDIKKILNWYNLLVDKKLMSFEEEEKEEKKAKGKAKAKAEDVSDEAVEKLAKTTAKKDKAAVKPKTSVATKGRAQKAQPAKGGSTKNKGIGVKSK
jgi:hypothetical protein